MMTPDNKDKVLKALRKYEDLLDERGMHQQAAAAAVCRMLVRNPDLVDHIVLLDKLFTEKETL